MEKFQRDNKNILFSSKASQLRYNFCHFISNIFCLFLNSILSYDSRQDISIRRFFWLRWQTFILSKVKTMEGGQDQIEYILKSVCNPTWNVSSFPSYYRSKHFLKHNFYCKVLDLHIKFCNKSIILTVVRCVFFLHTIFVILLSDTFAFPKPF